MVSCAGGAAGAQRHRPRRERRATSGGRSPSSAAGSHRPGRRDGCRGHAERQYHLADAVARAARRAGRAAASWQQRALDGRGGMVLVTGEPGAGKTALVQAFARRGAGRGAVCCGARATRSRRPGRSARSTTSPISSATPSRDALRDAAQPHEIFAAVFEHLRRDAVGARRRRPALGRPGHHRPAALPAPPHRIDPVAGGRRAPRRGARHRPPAAVAARRRGPLARRR